MSGKPLHDMYYPLRVAARFCPISSTTGHHPHVSSLHRWVKRGVLSVNGTRVYLRAKKRGSALCVTRGDLLEFFRATAGEAVPADEVAASANSGELTDRHRQTRRQISQELDDAGI
jgi:hypothetical protein